MESLSLSLLPPSLLGYAVSCSQTGTHLWKPEVDVSFSSAALHLVNLLSHAQLLCGCGRLNFGPHTSTA